MDKQEKANWQRIKDAMEAQGKTDNMFYQRAVVICEGGNDPLDKKLK